MTVTAERGTVIFDLDGTLVDSAPDLADSLDVVLTELGLEPEGLDGTRSLVGHGIPALVQGALARQGREAGADLALARFLEVYAGRLAARTMSYPGAAIALEALAHAGWRLVVCTNKREALARAILDALGLLPFFALVAGPDTFDAAKPDPAQVLRSLPVGAGPDYLAVLVGDSSVDVAAARAAGLPVLAVAWGYARVPAAELGADAVATTFDDVPALVEALADGRLGARLSIRPCDLADTPGETPA